MYRSANSFINENGLSGCTITGGNRTSREYEIPSVVPKIIIPKSYFEDRATSLREALESFHIDVLVHHASSSENYLFDVILVKSLGIPVSYCSQ